MNKKAIRHGDVILKPVTKLGGRGKQLAEYTVAYGEVTGHHHTLYPMHPGALMSMLEEGGKRVIKLEQEWSLRHQEHKEIIVPPGIYEIGIEREYDPFEKAMRKVID